jgi:hypothetical protein
MDINNEINHIFKIINIARCNLIKEHHIASKQMSKETKTNKYRILVVVTKIIEEQGVSLVCSHTQIKVAGIDRVKVPDLSMRR